MNYLAHAYLSFNDPEILTGNMVSDFVKGKKKFDYPIQIQDGMSLHRNIDEFTDSHPATKDAKEFFRSPYRLYAGAFIDVVYDHFLATDKNEFETPDKLFEFSQNVYQALEKNSSFFPAGFNKMFPYMKEHNWLVNYQYKWGIEKSFGGLKYRAKYIDETTTAFYIFNENYEALKNCYQKFFPDVKDFASRQYATFQ